MIFKFHIEILIAANKVFPLIHNAVLKVAKYVTVTNNNDYTTMVAGAILYPSRVLVSSRGVAPFLFLQSLY